MLLKRSIEIGSANMINWSHRWAIWEVANGNFIVYLLVTPMFSIFTLAIKFDCLFLTIFQSFHLFFIFIFDKLAPPP